MLVGVFGPSKNIRVLLLVMNEAPLRHRAFLVLVTSKNKEILTVVLLRLDTVFVVEDTNGGTGGDDGDRWEKRAYDGANGGTTSRLQRPAAGGIIDKKCPGKML